MLDAGADPAACNLRRHARATLTNSAEGVPKRLASLSDPLDEDGLANCGATLPLAPGPIVQLFLDVLA